MRLGSSRQGARRPTVLFDRCTTALQRSGDVDLREAGHGEGLFLSGCMKSTVATSHGDTAQQTECHAADGDSTRAGRAAAQAARERGEAPGQAGLAAARPARRWARSRRSSVTSATSPASSMASI